MNQTQVPVHTSEPGNGTSSPPEAIPESDQTFRTRHCALVGIPDAEFERRLFFDVLKPPVRLFVRIWWVFNRSAFTPDLDILRRFGRYERLSSIVQDASDMRSEYRRMRNFRGLRRLLQIRISGQRLCAVAARAFAEKPEA